MIFLAAYPAMNPIVPPAPIGIANEGRDSSTTVMYLLLLFHFLLYQGLDDFLRHSYKLPSGLILNPIEEDLAITCKLS
jgi:hypothetical protein